MKVFFLLVWLSIFCSVSSFASLTNDEEGIDQIISGVGKMAVSGNRDEDTVYQDQVKVSKKFLDLKKREYISKKAHLLLIDFMKDYPLQRESTLDITGLSARARIYLLNSIINFKINFLPQHKCTNYEQFQNLVSSNDFWKKIKKPGVAEFIDKIPTRFKIGDFVYKLEMGSTFHQKGSGRLYGLLSESSAEKYDQIYTQIKKYKDNLPKYSEILLQQKKDGVPIYRYNKKKEIIDERSRFLNGLNLLLDYEVARRLVDGDPHQDLPVITYINFIITHLDSHFKDLIVGKKLSEWGFSLPRYDNSLSLVAGDNRVFVAKKTIPELTDTQSSASIRRSLKCLHLSDEDSNDEYSGDEEDKKINPQQRKEMRTQFLETVSEHYIQGLRNTDSQIGEVLWGGDIELIEIAELHNLNITVYQYSRNSKGNIIKDSLGKPKIEANPSIGPQVGKPINLWLNGLHYQNYDPSNQEVRNVPGDGNCLFHAVLRAMNESDKSTIEEVSILRNAVADRFNSLITRINQKEQVIRSGTEENNWQPITVTLTHRNNNPIYSRFAAIFEAEDEVQLQDAISYLPPSNLLEEAKKLRN